MKSLDAAERTELLDGRATITVVVASLTLSLLHFAGSDLSFLMLDYTAWPQEPWRLITATLFHGSLPHLAFNLYWTWRFGFIVEPIFGTPATAGIFLVLALGSSAAEWALFGSLIGLSGVGFGLFGLLWALDRYHPSYRGAIAPSVRRVFVVWFFICILLSWAGVLAIANVAHGAGAILGGLLGWSLAGRAGSRRLLVLPGAILLIGLLATVGRPYVNFSGARGWELQYDAIEALDEKDYETALGLLLRSVRADPDLGVSWYNLGVTYERMGRPLDAYGAFLRAERLEPFNETFRHAVELYETRLSAGGNG